MAFPVKKFVGRFFSVNLKMIQQGVIVDFYRVFRADPSKGKDQETILKCGKRIMDKIKSGTLPHQTALEQISEVYLRRHDFEKAWSGFDTALEIFIDKSPDITEELNRLSYLCLMLATCHYNLGNRQQAIDTLTQAIRLGVPPDEFKGLMSEDGISEIQKIIEPGHGLYRENAR